MTEIETLQERIKTESDPVVKSALKKALSTAKRKEKQSGSSRAIAVKMPNGEIFEVAVGTKLYISDVRHGTDWARAEIKQHTVTAVGPSLDRIAIDGQTSGYSGKTPDYRSFYIYGQIDEVASWRGTGYYRSFADAKARAVLSAGNIVAEANKNLTTAKRISHLTVDLSPENPKVEVARTER